MDKDRRSRPLLWGASDHAEFENWVKENHWEVYEEWQNWASHLLDLYEYLEREEYKVIDEWLGGIDRM